MSTTIMGVQLAMRAVGGGSLEDRVSALEQQIDHNMSTLAELPAILQQEWRRVDDEVRNDSMQALDQEVERLERFVGITDSVKRPFIGVVFVVLGTAAGAAGNILSAL